jgi:hypothetical protein
MTVPCLENECDESGFAVLLCKETDWKQYHASKQTQANEVAANLQGQANYLVVLATGAAISVLPDSSIQMRIGLTKKEQSKRSYMSRKLMHTYSHLMSTRHL